MARLYCSKHGEEYKAQVASELSKQGFDGDGIAVTKGKLISGPWRCDHCNKELDEGDYAYFVMPLTPEMVDRFHEYDFSYEYEYFDVDPNEVELYGLEWPA